MSWSSQARIVGNTISYNTDDGVDVRRDSHADIANNTIDGNGDEGIVVGENSGVNLGSDTTNTFFDEPNETTVNNGDFGIRCFIGAYADVRLGSLNGDSGPTSFSGTCIYSLIVNP